MRNRGDAGVDGRIQAGFGGNGGTEIRGHKDFTGIRGTVGRDLEQNEVDNNRCGADEQGDLGDESTNSW